MNDTGPCSAWVCTQAEPRRMWGNGCLRAFQALRCGFESRHSLQVEAWGSSFNGRIPGLHPGDEGSIPSGSTNAQMRREGTVTLEVS